MTSSQGRANSESDPRRPRRGWRRGGRARRCDRRRLQLCRRWPRRSRSTCRWRASSLLLVRPALIAGPGKVFVWSDWSAIEARITPWLAASPGAEKVLDIFRANDRDPTRPDIYTIAAADILHKDPSAITKTERGIGKVATLALGFGGSVGALQEHGAELPHPPRRRRGASHRRRLARGEPMGAGILGRPPRRRKLRPVGRRDARLGDARPRSPRRVGSPSSTARTISAARCSWRCRRAGC